MYNGKIIYDLTNGKVIIWWGVFRLTAVPAHTGAEKLKRHHHIITFWVIKVINDHGTGGPRLVRHLCQKLLKNRTIVNLGQAHTSISANFPQKTALIKISPKIALFEVLVETYKNCIISRIALIKWRTNQGYLQVLRPMKTKLRVLSSI